MFQLLLICSYVYGHLVNEFPSKYIYTVPNIIKKEHFVFTQNSLKKIIAFKRFKQNTFLITNMFP